MAQTVIGFFEEAEEARKAVDQLENSGLSRQQVDISSGKKAGATRDADGRNTNKITDFFNSLFGHDSREAQRFSAAGLGGRTIVTVHARTAEEARRAADILDAHGALEVDERGKTVAGDQAAHFTERETIIPLIQEEAQVGTRANQTGGLKIRSRIVEKPVEEHLRLREEHVHVERKTVNRPYTATEGTAFQERDIVLTESAEIPVIRKEARVVEEIRVSKEVTEHEQVVHTTVRHNEVDVENLGREGIRNEDDRTTESTL